MYILHEIQYKKQRIENPSVFIFFKPYSYTAIAKPPTKYMKFV